jgi:hypothetical protein
LSEEQRNDADEMKAGGGFMVTDVLYNESISSRWKPIRRGAEVVGGIDELLIQCKEFGDAEMVHCLHGTSGDDEDIACAWPPRIYRQVGDDGRKIDYSVPICWRCDNVCVEEKRIRERGQRYYIPMASNESWEWYIGYTRREKVWRKKSREERKAIPKYFPDGVRNEGDIRGRTGYDGREWAYEIWPEEVMAVRRMEEIVDGNGNRARS